MTPHGHRTTDAGFTLIELLIGALITAVVAGAIASAIIISFRTVGATTDRIAQSHDAQNLSFWLLPDLQSLGSGYTYPDVTRAAGPTTNNCSTPLPAGTYVLNLTWTDTTPTTPIVYQSDYYTASDSGGGLVLSRFYCSTANAATKIAVKTPIVHHVNPAAGSVTFCHDNASCPLGPTLTVSTIGPANAPYTFSVTGAGR